MVKIEHLHKSFGKTEVLKGINLTINEGEVVAILGPSGSGKSTLLRSLIFLERPDKGIIQLGNTIIDTTIVKKSDYEIARKKTAMVFQNYNLFANKTALENITLPLIIGKKWTKKQAEDKAYDLLELVGLTDRTNYLPAELSGGQQQRVGIARALALEPEIILFDEPTSALDPELVDEVLQVIKKIAEKKITMLIVTHELEFAKDIADQIVFMDEGKIIEKNDTKNFFEHPKEERTKKFLSRYMKQLEYYI